MDEAPQVEDDQRRDALLNQLLKTPPQPRKKRVRDGKAGAGEPAPRPVSERK